ncbi:MAG: TonB-dependent receptor [Alistipes sp.]
MTKFGVLCLLSLMLTGGEVAAQIPDNEYYPYAAVSEEYAPVIPTDTALFYRAVQSAEDLFSTLTDYNLSFTAFKRRGQEYALRAVTVNGLEVSSRYFTALRSLLIRERRQAGLKTTAQHIGLTNGIREMDFTSDTPLSSRYAAVNFTDRNYLSGAKISLSETYGRGWNMVAAIHARTGRDMHIEGVFTHSVSVNLRATKRFNDRHALSFLLILPPSMRGMRSATSDEAFLLTGDRLYNPSWGFQQGKVRNAHVRRDFVPLAVVTYEAQLSLSTHLSASLGAEVGTEKYSALGWYGAATPMPDNYRYLPSYTGDKETEWVWRNNDTRYTQIDWDGLYLKNRRAGDATIYAVEDRVERICNLHFAADFMTRFSDRLSLCYGARFRHTGSRNYKQMRDLLGGKPRIDLDQYLIDDDTYGNKLQNNLRDPNRRIDTGDRFGYDYELTGNTLGVMALVQYRADRFKLDVGVEVRDETIRRTGNFEKELFPGVQSYGRSATLRFTPYTVKAVAGWSFSPRSYLEVAFLAGALAPAYADLFLQPQYNNRTIDTPVTRKLYAAELTYNYTGRVVDLRLAAFVTSSRDETRTRRSFDDLSATFCDRVVEGIGTRCYGLEAAAKIRLTYRWNIALAASAGRYTYAQNPRVSVYSDVDNSVVDAAAESYMGGCKIGGTPQVAGSAEVSYFAASGWGFRVTANYVGLRYVEPMALRRTARVAKQAALSQEIFDLFTVQERLNDAFTLDASLFKSFYFDRSRLTISLMLKNLLNDRDMVYNGYESVRMRRHRSGDATVYTPFDSRRTYAYPRSFYLSVSYKF